MTDVLSCDVGCEADIDFHTTEPDLQQSLDLSAGRYVIRQSRPIDEPGSIGFLLSLREG